MSEVVAKAQTTILAETSDAFDAIVQADKVTTFFPDRASGDLRIGSSIMWQFDHAGAKVDLRVLELERPTRIVFEWNAAQAGFKRVEFGLSQSRGATRIEVVEKGYSLSADDVAKAIQQTNGWAEFLAFLKARLQFDIELRAGRQK